MTSTQMTSTHSVLEINKKLVHRFIEECWNGGSRTTIPMVVAENCRYHDPVFPHMIAGVESLQRHIEGCRKAFPDLKFTVTDTIAERDEVVVHWSANGTQRGEFLGIPPTNVNALTTGTSIFRIEDFKIVEQWSNWNLMSLMEQLGVKPATRTHVGWE
jgi:steroid delta-isomerase-like uncharacterized protein